VARFDRISVIVLDSFGIGALPDADEYGDEGANTLEHIIEAAGLEVPNLARLGLCRLTPLLSAVEVVGAWGRMAEKSAGKDTITGHWEMTGVITYERFPVYPDGFPAGVIQAFEKAIGRGVLGNYPASGTVIIEELGEEHERTGKPIVYTSADSVFQIAAHERVVPVVQLYEFCEKARKILQGPHGVARVIARPFVGAKGAYSRTGRRKDFALPPPKPTILDLLKAKNYEVIGIGKVLDVFSGRGITKGIHTEDNHEGMREILQEIRREWEGLLFANLTDFDSKFGHRRNPAGYRNALQDFDRFLPNILEELHERDLLIITADHGNDPIAPGSDHTREYVPLLVYTPMIKETRLGTRKTFGDIGATIAKNFGIHIDIGDDFLDTIVRRLGSQ